MWDVPKTLDVQKGDVIMTSNYSSIFPPGIRIGVVTTAQQVPGELFQAIELAPSVDFTHLEEVFVVLASADSSRAAIDQQAKEK